MIKTDGEIITLLNNTLANQERDLMYLCFGIGRNGRAVDFNKILRKLDITHRQFIEIERCAFKKLNAINFDIIKWSKEYYASIRTRNKKKTKGL